MRISAPGGQPLERNSKDRGYTLDILALDAFAYLPVADRAPGDAPELIGELLLRIELEQVFAQFADAPTYLFILGADFFFCHGPSFSG